MRKAAIGLVFLLGPGHSAVAQTMEVPRLESVLVRARLLDGSEAGVKSLAFDLQHVGATLDVIGFSIDISSDPTRVSPESPALSFSKPHFSISTQINVLRIGQENLVRVGSSFAPEGWASAIDKSSRLRWGAITDSAPLRPGDSKGPFVISFHGLIGIRRAYLDPDLAPYLPNVDEESVNIDDLFDQMDAARQAVFTLGPRAAPRTPDPALILAELVAHMRRARDLGWVRELEASRTVDDLLALARSHMSADEPGRARLALDQATEVVNSQGCSEWQCSSQMTFTSEARALLLINLQYTVQLLSSNSVSGTDAGPEAFVE